MDMEGLVSFHLSLVSLGPLLGHRREHRSARFCGTHYGSRGHLGLQLHVTQLQSLHLPPRVGLVDLIILWITFQYGWLEIYLIEFSKMAPKICAKSCLARLLIRERSWIHVLGMNGHLACIFVNGEDIIFTRNSSLSLVASNGFSWWPKNLIPLPRGWYAFRYGWVNFG